MADINKATTAWLNEKTGEIHTPRGRMIYPALLAARRIKGQPDSAPKFGTVLIFPKGCDLSLIVKEVGIAAQEKLGSKWQSNKKVILPVGKTAEREDLAAFADEYPFFVKTTAFEDKPPFIYNPDLTKFDAADASQIYAGRWASLAGNVKGYDNVSKGVNYYINRIQLLKHDEPLAGARVDTSEGFEACEVGEREADGRSPARGAAKMATTDDAGWDPLR